MTTFLYPTGHSGLGEEVGIAEVGLGVVEQRYDALKEVLARRRTSSRYGRRLQRRAKVSPRNGRLHSDLAKQ